MTNRISSNSAAAIGHHIPPTLAPAWHTALTVLLVLAPAIQSQFATWHNPGAAVQPPPAIPFYLTGTVVLCIFLAFTWWGLRLKGHALASVIGGRWSSWKQVAGDVGL